MALLHTWQQVWRRGCSAVDFICTVWDGREKQLEPYIWGTMQSPGAPVLSDIISKHMLPSNKISLGTVLPSNKFSLQEETAESLVWKRHDGCSQRSPLSACLLPTAFGLTFISNAISEPPSRCGDVITSHSADHRAVQRTQRCSGKSRIAAVEFFYRRLGFSFWKDFGQHLAKIFKTVW